MSGSFKAWLLHALPMLGCLLVAWRWASWEEPLAPLVRVEQGLLLGAHRLTHYDHIPYFSFKGIPYAKPPLGELRFKAPEPPDDWSDVRAALEEGPMCCQPHTEIYWMPPEINKMFLPRTLRRAWLIVSSLPRLFGQIIRFYGQHEDCLYLNVYTKQIPGPGEAGQAGQAGQAGGGAPLSPVVVYIHGGAFYTGTANSHIYGPDFLLREDLVVVTVQYRLGALGFLAPGGSAEVPGNAGLQDQAAALRWVRRNIAHFGGDPDSVTLVGQSAGGASVHYLALSPGSRDLFHRAVQLSGCALNDWAFVQPRVAAERARRLAHLLGCPAGRCDHPDTLVDFLRTQTVADIITASYSVFQNQEGAAGYIAPFVPTIDGASWGASGNESAEGKPSAFLYASPTTTMESLDYKPKPTLVGHNSNEGMIIMLPDVITAEMSPTRRNFALLRQDFERVVPLDLGLPRGSDKSRMVANMMRQHYFRNGMIEDNENENLSIFVQMYGDIVFNIAMGRYMRLLNKVSPLPVYLYLFTFDGRLSVVKKLVRSELPGVSHGDELGYLFPIEMMPAEDVRPGDVDMLVRDKWTRIIANFAKFGTPTVDGDSTLGVVWPASTAEAPHYMEIGADLAASSGYPFNDTISFWESVYNAVQLDFVQGRN